MKAVAERATHEFWVGATGRKIRAQIRDDDGNVIDQTGNTVELSATLSEVYKIEAAAMTVEVGTDGWVYYMPSGSEVDEDGLYLAQIMITDTGALIDFTEQFDLNVKAPVRYIA